MGIPSRCDAVAHTFLPQISALYPRAYNLIYNEWYRDENLQDSVTVNKDDGPDAMTDYSLLQRGKRHDYFTSCLPNPQKGATAVGISLTGNADVYGNGKALGLEALNNSSVLTNMGLAVTNDTIPKLYVDQEAQDADVGDQMTITDDVSGSKAVGVVDSSGESGLIADLSTASAIDINDLRLAVATQQFLEIDARGGTRYVELLKAHFGVVSPDFRLQRPEYLGGGSSPVDIHAVTQTSESNTTDQGKQAAHVTMNARHGFSKSFVEHGVLMGIVSVRADLNYQQGVHKMFTRSTRYDFYHPVFANLGEQAVLNQEIFVDTAGEANTDVFGYQERWAEYRYAKSLITGKLNSDDAATLDSWHLAQDFSAMPSLNASFIVETPPMSRIMAVTTEPQIVFDSFTEMKHARCMPVYSIPGLRRF